MSNELKVILTLVDNMSKNLAGVQSNFSNFGKQMDNVIGTVGKVAGAFGAILAVDKVREAVQAGIAWGDSIATGAKKVGMSTRAFQENDFIAKQMGTSVELVAKGMRGLALTADTNAKGFDKFGISVRDVHTHQMLPINDIFWNTVKRLSEIGNETERTAATQKLFGKAAGEVLAIVNSSSGEIDRAREAYKKYHLELSDGVISKLHEAAQASQIADIAFKNMSAEFSATFTPAIIKAEEALAHFFHFLGGNDDRENLDNLVKSITQNANDLRSAREELDKVSKAPVGISHIFGELNGTGFRYQGDKDQTIIEVKKSIAALEKLAPKLEKEKADLLARINKPDSLQKTGGDVDLGTDKGDNGASRRAELLYQNKLRTDELLASADATNWEARKNVLKDQFEHEQDLWKAAGLNTRALVDEQTTELEVEAEKFFAGLDKKADSEADRLKRKHDEANERAGEMMIGLKNDNAHIGSKQDGPEGEKIAAKEEYNDQLAKIDELSAADEAARQDLKYQAYLNLQKKFHSIDLNETEQHLHRMAEITAQMSETIGRSLGGMFSGQKGAVKKGLKEIFDTLIDFAEKSLLADNALILGKNLGDLGVAGFATAAAQITDVNAAAAGLKSIQFAGGGIVPHLAGVPSSGDHIPARVNPGEVILNQQQQARALFAIANGAQGSGASGGHVVMNFTEGGNISRQIESEYRRGGDFERVMKNVLEKYGALS